MAIEFKLDKKSVNSKILFTEIAKFIEEGLNQMGSIFGNESGRIQFIVVLNDFFHTLQVNGVVTHWNIMCDLRNNKVADMEDGQYRLSASYKQRNCLNTTELQYLIRVDKTEEWSIDFTI